jgi:outer membrane protein TolC
MIRKIYTCLLAGISILTFTATAGASGINDLFSEIERNNGELKALREEGRAAVLESSSENTLDATSIEYSPFFKRGADGVTSSELIVTQEFDFPTLYVARAKATDAIRMVSDEEYAAARRTLLLEAGGLYLDLVKNRRMAGLLSRRLEIADSLTGVWERGVKDGTATMLDLNRIRMDAMQQRTSLLDNESERVRLEGELRVLNGNKPFVAEGVDYPDFSLPESAAQLTELWLSADPDIKAGAAQLTLSQQEERVARQGWLPKLTVGYRRNTEMEEASNGFVVGASFPLFTTGKKVKAAVAKKRAADLRLETIRQRSESQLTARYEEARALLRTISAYDRQLMDETVSLLTKSVMLGQTSITDYYTEVQTIKEREETYQDLLNRYNRLLLQITVF